MPAFKAPGTMNRVELRARPLATKDFDIGGRAWKPPRDAGTGIVAEAVPSKGNIVRHLIAAVMFGLVTLSGCDATVRSVEGSFQDRHSICGCMCAGGVLYLSFAILIALTVREPRKSPQELARQAAEQVERQLDRARAREARELKSRDDEARRERERLEADARHRQANVQAERDAARKHLSDFYMASVNVLYQSYPPALLQAFLHAEMHDALEPLQLWAIANAKIAELQPIIAEGQRRQQKEQRRLAAQALRARQYDQQIAELHARISRLAASTLDRDVVADEREELERQINRLVQEKELLDATNPEGADS